MLLKPNICSRTTTNKLPCRWRWNKFKVRIALQGFKEICLIRCFSFFSMFFRSRDKSKNKLKTIKSADNGQVADSNIMEDEVIVTILN